MTKPTNAEILAERAERADDIADSLDQQDSMALRHLAASATDPEEHDKLLSIAHQIDNND